MLIGLFYLLIITILFQLLIPCGS